MHVSGHFTASRHYQVRVPSAAALAPNGLR